MGTVRSLATCTTAGFRRRGAPIAGGELVRRLQFPDETTQAKEAPMPTPRNPNEPNENPDTDNDNPNDADRDAGRQPQRNPGRQPEPDREPMHNPGTPGREPQPARDPQRGQPEKAPKP
jgi:hypothetical protein